MKRQQTLKDYIRNNHKRIRRVNEYYSQKVPDGVSVQEYKRVFSQQKRRLIDGTYKCYDLIESRMNRIKSNIKLKHDPSFIKQKVEEEKTAKRNIKYQK